MLLKGSLFFFFFFLQTFYKVILPIFFSWVKLVIRLFSGVIGTYSQSNVTEKKTLIKVILQMKTFTRILLMKTVFWVKIINISFFWG